MYLFSAFTTLLSNPNRNAIGASVQTLKYNDILANRVFHSFRESDLICLLLLLLLLFVGRTQKRDAIRIDCIDSNDFVARWQITYRDGRIVFVKSDACIYDFRITPSRFGASSFPETTPSGRNTHSNIGKHIVLRNAKSNGVCSPRKLFTLSKPRLFGRRLRACKRCSHVFRWTYSRSQDENKNKTTRNFSTISLRP